MPIVYGKFFALLKEQKKTMYDLRKDKVVGVATIEKMRKSEGHIDTRSIEKLCEYLDCQPGDIMEYVREPSKNCQNCRHVCIGDDSNYKTKACPKWEPKEGAEA